MAPERKPQKVELKLLRLDSTLTDTQIEEIGKEYVRTHFSLHDQFHKPLPMCKTKDGIEVFFRGTTYHILRCNKGKELRNIEISRIETLHWIIPVIEERANRLVLLREGTGKELGGEFRENLRYRIYWVPKLMYMVLTYYDKRCKSLILLTAYPVTKPKTRWMLRKLFPPPQINKAR